MSIIQNVSRETIANLEKFEELIRKWSPAINLVAKSTLSDVRARHVDDSSNLFDLIPLSARKVVDIGSGGGLPGLVLAIIAIEKRPDLSFTLVESDQRKAAFLRTASIQLGLNPEIIMDRIEDAPPQNADVVTARALAPLPKLLSYVQRHIAIDGTALLQKGVKHAEEVALARRSWSFALETVPVETISGSVVLKIKNLMESS